MSWNMETAGCSGSASVLNSVQYYVQLYYILTALLLTTLFLKIPDPCD